MKPVIDFHECYSFVLFDWPLKAACEFDGWRSMHVVSVQFGDTLELDVLAKTLERAMAEIANETP
jgi:hypothetical protein